MTPKNQTCAPQRVSGTCAQTGLLQSLKQRCGVDAIIFPILHMGKTEG